MGVPGHFYGNTNALESPCHVSKIFGTESRNFVKKPFNKKIFFPKKEKNNYKSSRCASGRQVKDQARQTMLHCEKIIFFVAICV